MATAPIVYRSRWRAHFVRGVATFAALFALVGIVGCVFAYRAVDAAENGTRGRLRQLSRTTAQAATSLRVSRGTATNAAGTVGTARDSLGNIARTVDESATTVEEIAGIINFPIPFSGQRPLAGVDERFRAQARQLRAIAGQLGQTGAALDSNAADVRRIGDEVGTLATQIEAIAGEIGGYADDPNTGIPAIARGVRFALVWIALLHALLFAMSIALFLLTVEPGLRRVRMKVAGAPTAPGVPDAGNGGTRGAEDAVSYRERSTR